MSIIGLSMAALPCCTREDVEAGSAAPACRLAGLRAEHNTVAGGGNTRSAVASPSRIRRWPCSLASASLAHAAERERPGNRLGRLDADREAR
jgi:hypothetical protein